MVDERRGVCGIKYPPGVALLQLPFVSPWADPKLREGFSREAHAIVLALGSGLLLLIATLSYLTLRRLDVCPLQAQAVVGAFIFGTGLFHYATYDASFSHVYSAGGVALLLWLVTRARETGWRPWMLGLFGLSTFWLSTVRQTNVLLTLLIAGVAIIGTDHRSARRVALIAVGTTALALLLQVAYNQYVTGTLTLFSYGREGFASWGGRFGDVWFSYERGLSTYYPIMIAAMVLGLFSGERLLGLAFAIGVTGYAFLYGSWHSWMLGHGMGHRGFVELAPLAMVVFGSALQRLQPRWRLVAIGVTGLSVYVTLQVMVGYWRGSFPFTGANSDVYWRHLLRPSGSQLVVAFSALIATILWARLGTDGYRADEHQDARSLDGSGEMTQRPSGVGP